MTCRNKYIVVLACGVAGLLLGSWLLGEHAPNALVLLVGALVLAIWAARSQRSRVRA